MMNLLAEHDGDGTGIAPMTDVAPQS